jgi:hypothetical protein
MPKATAPDARSQRRHNPLHEELIETSTGGPLRKVARNKRKEKQDKPEDYVDSGLSKKILQLAKEQQDEIEEEKEALEKVGGDLGFLGGNNGQMRFEQEEDSDEGEYEEYEEYEDVEEVEEVEVDEGDEEMFARFMPQQTEQRISLADKILEKIAEHEARLAGNSGAAPEEDVPQLPQKVIEVYSKYVPKSPNSYICVCVLITKPQGRNPPLPLQVRQAPQSFQDHPFPPQLGRNPLHHPPRQMDRQRMLRGHQALRFPEVVPMPKIPQHYPYGPYP